MKSKNSSGDEAWSEITIQPDGRLYIFGMTRPLLEILANVPTVEDEWRKLLEHPAGERNPADQQPDHR